MVTQNFLVFNSLSPVMFCTERPWFVGCLATFLAQYCLFTSPNITEEKDMASLLTTAVVLLRVLGRRGKVLEGIQEFEP